MLSGCGTLCLRVTKYIRTKLCIKWHKKVYTSNDIIKRSIHISHFKDIWYAAYGLILFRLFCSAVWIQKRLGYYMNTFYLTQFQEHQSPFQKWIMNIMNTADIAYTKAEILPLSHFLFTSPALLVHYALINIKPR